MFRFYATNYSDEEIMKLYEIWREMITDFLLNQVECKNECDSCHYKNICTDLVKTEDYFISIMKKRNLIDILNVKMSDSDSKVSTPDVLNDEVPKRSGRYPWDVEVKLHNKK